MKINKDDMKKYMVLVAAMMIAGMVSAQEVEGFDSAEIADTLIANVDTVELDPDPEWYVAPLIPETLRAPQHAPRKGKASTAYVTDSVQTYDINGNLVEVSTFEYDQAGRTIGEMIWTVNEDGSRYGSSRVEYAFNAAGTQTMTATYVWDDVNKKWNGSEKTEFVYNAAGKMETNTTFDWASGDWTPKTRYTYTYDASNREIEYVYYTRNASLQLIPNKSRVQAYYGTGTSKKTLEIQYTAHNGSQWSAGTKKVWEYNTHGNQSLYEYYSSYSNGNWNGSTRETWEYLGNTTTKTLYIKQTWSNGDWTNSTKEVWGFNANNKQTLHEKYNWSNGDWTISLREISDYDAKGNTILAEKYELSGGVLKPKSKTEYAFNSNNKKVYTLTYKVTNNEFVKYDSTIIAYDAAGNTTESGTKYILNDNVWVGNGIRTIKTFNSAKKEIVKLAMTWPTNATDWMNSQLDSTIYSGANITRTATYKWQNDAWVGTKRTDNHYNAAGLNDTIKTYTNDGTGWIYSQRTVNTYDAKKNKILVHIADWKENKWTLKSMEKWDLLYDVHNNQILSAKWKCSADSVWQGTTKDTANYSATNKPLYTAKYKGWKNNDWVPTEKLEYAYDEADRKIMQQRFVWTSGTWEGDYRDEFGYDAQGHQNVYITYLEWNNDSQSWIGSTKTETTFDSNDHPVTSVLSVWGGNTWQPLFQYQYTYDNSGREIEQTVEQYSGGAWVYTDKYEHAYKGSTLVKDNAYVWLNDQWVFRSRSEVYYDDDAQAKLRREIQGFWNEGVLESFIDNLYFYNVDFPFYTIRFENYDGTLLESHSVQETKTPVYEGAKPSRPADAQYTYTFKGWTPAIVTVTGDATYTAEYDSVVNRYRITWLNADDVEVAVDSLEYGAMPSHEDVVKPSTSEWAYLFAGWSPAIVTVAGDATYKAQLDSVQNGYRITWLDADDTELAADSLSYGAMPSHEYVLKANTAEWTYSFVGWTPEIATVTGDATYKAQIDSVRNRYRITWLDADDTEIAVDSLVYGATPSREYVLKANTAEWTYSFVGWTPEIAAVSADATYKAQIDSVRNRYRITWLDADDTEIAVDSLAYSATPSREYVLKANTAEWTYSFVGWEPAITSVTGDATYKAQIDSVRNSYRITWLNADEVEVAVDSLAYGATPSHEDLVKTNTAEWTYSFVGWTPAITSVTGDATYKAQFDSVRNSYLVTFKNDGDTLQSTLVAYGTMPVYGGETPTKQGDAQYSYTFSGWDAELAAVTGEATYNAMFSSTVNTYLVTFKNGDDILQSTQVAYGTMPEYTGNEPTKQADAQYTYNFNGWDAELVSVTGEAIYNATFSSTINNYRITFKNGEDTLQSTLVAYGTMPVYGGETPTKQADAQYTYSFNGWDAELVAVTGETTYNATFSSTINNYTITWLLDDGTKIDEQSVAYGTTPSHTDAHKDNTVQYTITFVGWDKAFAAVTGDETYTAVFDSVVNRYTVIFYFEDGVTVLDSKEFEYGEMPSTSLIPSLPATAKYTYTFAGWSPELQPVTGNATYTPVFDSIVNTYTVTFVNYNDMVLQSSQVPYDDVPEYTGETPIKPSNAMYHYVFTGWTPELVAVTGDAHYKAVYDQVLNRYTIIFYDEDGLTILDSVEVDYGEMPETSVIPTKADDEEYTYTFAGWSPKIVSATKNTSYTATYTATRKTEGLWDVEAAEKAQKVMIDGVIYILRGGKIYTLDGTEVE